MSSTTDTTALTNIGFAIFLGLASVSFGWSRAITGKEKKTQEIVEIGESCIEGGLGFLCASAIKFVYLNLNAILLIKTVPFLHELFKWTNLIIFNAGFTFGYGTLMVVAFRIILVTFGRHYD